MAIRPFLHSKLFMGITSLLIIVAYAIAVELYFGWKSLWQSWIGIGWITLAEGLMLMMITYWVRSVRLQDYFRTAMAGQFWLGFRLNLMHNLVNNLLPMRTGEVSFPLLMKRYFGLSLTQSSSALLWLRLLDLHTILCFAGIALVLHLKNSLIHWLALWLFSMIPMVTELLRSQTRQWLLHLSPESIHSVIEKIFAGFPSSFFAFTRAWLLTWLNWGIKLALFCWMMQLFAPLPLSASLLGAIGGEISSILPIHAPAGLGTYEAGVVAGALLTSSSNDQVLFAAINLHFLIILSTLVGGLLALCIPEKLYSENSADEKKPQF